MFEKIRSSNIAIVFVVCLSIFTDFFLYGLIMPVLPYALVQRIGIDEKDLQFWSTTFLATWAGANLSGSIIFGFAINLGVSKRISFITGQAILGAATILFMVSRNLPLLVIARILQGVSGGAISTLGYTLTSDAVGKDSIGMAIGYVTTSLSTGYFFGPVVGGPLYDAAGYIWVFIPAIILIGLEILMRMSLIEPEDREEAVDADERRRLLNSNTTENGRPTENGHPTNRTRKNSAHRLPYRRSSMGDPTKIHVKDAKRSPLLILLGNRRFVVAMFGLFVGNNFVGAIESVLPIFAYDQLQFSSTKIGLLFLAATWPQFLGPLAGWIVDRAGPKWPAAFGFVVGGVALILLRLTEHESSARLPLLIVLLTGYGACIVLFEGPIIADVTYAVEDLETEQPGIFGEHGGLALAFGLQNAAYAAGAMVGPMYAGALYLSGGWGTLGLFLGIVSLVTAIPVVMYTGGSIFENWGKLNSDAAAHDEA